MEEAMRKVGMKMSISMGLILSFCLSLVGNLTSGHFTVPGFLVSFAASTVISLIIGFVIPTKKVGDSVCDKLNLKPGLGRRCMETLVSDLIYTPIITLCMIILARKMGESHGAQFPPFIVMFLSSLATSLLVAYVIIFFLMPFLIKTFTKDLPKPPMGN